MARRRKPHASKSDREAALNRAVDAWQRDCAARRVAHQARRDLLDAVLTARAAGLRDTEIANLAVAPTGEPLVTNACRRKFARLIRARLRRDPRRRPQKGTVRSPDLQAREGLLLSPEGVADNDRHEEQLNMERYPIRRRVVEEWYGPPSPDGDHDQPEDLNRVNREEALDGEGDLDGDDLDDDE